MTILSRNVSKELLAVRRKFQTFYANQLKGDYKVLEEKRRPYLKSFYFRVVVSALVLYVLWRLSFIISAGAEVWGEKANNIYGAVVLFLVVFIFQPIRDYKQDTKKLVMDKILSFWGDFHYQSEGCAEHMWFVLEESRLFKSFNECVSDDCFSGTYNGVKIAVSEQNLQHIYYLGDYEKKVHVFKGILISFDMAKNFSGQTVVRKKGILPQFLTGFFKEKAFNEVNLEDVVFDKHWDVQSTDQIEARYVLTPGLMERMLEVKKRFGGNKIEFSFWDNKVLIAVHTNKDMFETTSLFCSALSYHKVSEVIYQFWAVFSVADLLLGKDKERM